MYFVYIIYSPKVDQYYVGSSDNLQSRLNHHNGGHTPSTKKGAPNWELKYSETLPDGKSALKREKEIKDKKQVLLSSNLEFWKIIILHDNRIYQKYISHLMLVPYVWNTYFVIVWFYHPRF